MTDRYLNEITFMGKITRSMTHEMTNVLAAIGENSALGNDILSLDSESSFPSQQRLGRAFNVIDNLVRRGVDLSNRLNEFAHSTDQSTTTVDLNDMVVKTASFAARLSELKRVGLDVVEAENTDRRKVYAAIGKKTGTTAEVVGKRRALKIAEIASPGDWLQNESGQWYRKK